MKRSHYHSKRILSAFTAGIMSTAMVASAMYTAVPMTVSAASLVEYSNFDHLLLPWQFVSVSPAKQSFDVKSGAAHSVILVPSGKDSANYELQFRRRGLQFKEGHEYKISFKVKASREGMEITSQFCNYPGMEYYFVLDGKAGKMTMGPDMGGTWGTPLKLSTEYQEISGTFIPAKDLEGVEWSFDYAKDYNYGGNAIAGDEIWFDDMQIECLTCPDDSGGCTGGIGMVRLNDRDYSGQAYNFISVNQLGYDPDLAKIAVLGDNKGDVLYGASSIDLSGEYTWELVDAATNEAVTSGTIDTFKKDADSADTVGKIDFSEWKTEGTYYLRIKDKEWRSFEFQIKKDLYADESHNLLTNALNYFYQSRSGQEIKPEYITSGDTAALAHNDKYQTDTAAVQKLWTNDYWGQEAAVDYKSSSITANGGWYESDGYGKNLVSGGMSLWLLQNMYERSTSANTEAKFADGSGICVVPETDNEIPDILDECRYELDFMSQMKVSEDEPTWGKYAGLYYSELTDNREVGLTATPWDYMERYGTTRIVKPPTFAATLNYAACAAQAARLWQKYDEKYAAELLQSAKDAYEAFMQNYYPADFSATVHPEYMYECLAEILNETSLYAPLYLDPYGDLEVLDDAYWAACELFTSCSVMGDDAADAYMKDISGYEPTFGVNTRIYYDEGSYTMMGWGDTGSAGSLTLALHKDLLDDKQKTALEKSILDTADSYIETEEMQGYGIPYKYDGPGYYSLSSLDPNIYVGGYEEGSNARAVMNMIAMAYAYDQTGDVQYLNGVVSGMDYLFGCNPLSFSYVTGYGSYSEQNPSHVFWAHELDRTLPAAPDGVLSGGPNAQFYDDYMLALGFVSGDADNPSQRCFIDSVESTSTNSTSLEWNAALAWIVSFMQEQTAGKKTDPVQPDDPDQPDKPDQPDAVVWGDCNGDAVLDVSDAVLLARLIAEDADATISEEGLELANVVKGDLDSDDVIAILMSLAKLIDAAQFPLDELP